MSKADYDGVIGLLQPVTQQLENSALRALLEKAQSQKKAIEQTADDVVRRLQIALEHEQYQDAVQFLEGQPQTLLSLPAIRELAARARESSAQDRKKLKVIGVAYAALDKQDVTTGWFSLQSALQDDFGSNFLRGISERYKARRERVANRALSSRMEDSRIALQEGNAKLANELLAAASSMADYASPELQEDLRCLSKEASKSKQAGHFWKRNSTG
jgi:hypothetical protein